MQTNDKTKTKHATKAKIVVIVSAAAAVLGVAPLLAAPATTDNQVAQQIAAKAQHGSSAVIARVTSDLTQAQLSQLTKLGADVTWHLGFIHSIALTLPTHNLRTLASLPFVTHLSYDGTVKKSDDFTCNDSGAYAAYSTYGLDGTGVNVAVIDSGIGNSSPDLQKQVYDAVSFIPNAGPKPPPNSPTQAYIDAGSVNDTCGHGTHVAGIIGGNGRSSSNKGCTQTFYGIARNARLINVRVLDAYGQGSISTVLAGIQWVVANRSTDNIRVMNLSLGHPVSESYATDPLCQAVEAAWKAGIVVVCAAGNNGRASAVNMPGASNEGWGTAYGSIQSPGNDPYIITVGATKQLVRNRGNSHSNGNGNGKNATDVIATYSSRGPSRLDFVLKPDIIAPGNQVISVVAKNSALFYFNGGTNQIPLSCYLSKGGTADPSNAYFRLSGTSMASPVVAGAAALLLQANPNLSPDTVKARLMASADKWLDPDGNADPLTYGAGYLDIPAALASTVTPTQYALSPQLTISATGDILVNTSLTVWGSKALSGVSTIWGSKALSGVSTLYGSKALSGVNTLYGSKALSGVNTIYGSSVWSDKAICDSASPTVDLSNVAINGE